MVGYDRIRAPKYYVFSVFDDGFPLRRCVINRATAKHVRHDD